MIYAIGENKIVRATEDGSAVAEVHFEPLRPGVYEITEVLTAGTGENDTDLEKIMTKTADHMKRNAYRIYTRDPFAKEWFAKHPQYADILTTNHSSMKRKDGEDSSSEYAEAPRRRKSAAEALSHKKSTPPAPQRTASRTAARTTAAAAASAAPAAAAEPEAEPVFAEETRPQHKKGRFHGRLVDPAELPSARSRAVGRIIQWVCGFLAALCAILFAVAYFAGSGSINESLSSTAQGRMIFQFFSLVFIAFCVLLFLWTISLRRYHTAERNLKLDVGRGLLGFLLILVFLSFTGSLQTISEHHVTVNDSFAGVSMGIIGFLTVLNVYKRYILFAAAGGCVLSMVRKFLGR